MKYEAELFREWAAVLLRKSLCKLELREDRNLANAGCCEQQETNGGDENLLSDTKRTDLTQ
jgi:hypothetical protein